jgi:hypothetical protein
MTAVITKKKKNDWKMDSHNATMNNRYVRSNETCNMDLRDELERTIAHYVNAAIVDYDKAQENEFSRKMDAPYNQPSVRSLIEKDKESLLFKFFIEDVVVSVYATTHLHKRIMQREVDKHLIKKSILDMERHHKDGGNLLDRHNGHDFVVKNYRDHVSVAGYSYLADSGMKIVLSTCLANPFFFPKPWAEAIVIPK